MSNFIFSVPDVWVLSELPLVAEINMGQSPSSADVNELGEGIVFFQGKAEFGKLYPIPKKYCTKPAKVASEGSILLSVRAPVGPTNIAKQLTAIGRGLAAISARREITNGKYLLYYFRCIEPWLSNQGTGTTFKAISGQFIKELAMPLPPLAEQKIIADKLDDLLARVESIKTRLENIPEILKKFRQSVLSAAVSGKLTEVNASDYKEISSVAKVIGGLTKNGKRNQISQQFPYLRVANVYENELRLDDMSVIGVQDKELDRVLLHEGDILIVEGNGSLDQIGRAAIWNGEIENCVHQNHLIKVRVNNDINSKFLLYYFMSPQGKEEIVSKATSGAGLYTLSISKISSIKVPIYTAPEQVSIVNTTDKLFSYVGSIEKILDNTLSKINNLTQSILAKAFRGELTAQWREENFELISGLNSAEALLEKITAEKLAAGTVKKRAKKTSH